MKALESRTVSVSYACACGREGVFNKLDARQVLEPSKAGIAAWIAAVTDFSSSTVDVVVTAGLVNAKAEAAMDPNDASDAYMIAACGLLATYLHCSGVHGIWGALFPLSIIRGACACAHRVPQ